MNIELRQGVRERRAQSQLDIVDCDIHPRNSFADLRPYLSNRWWDHLQTYGLRPRHGFAKAIRSPK
jgi:hypothetical protein